MGNTIKGGVLGSEGGKKVKILIEKIGNKDIEKNLNSIVDNYQKPPLGNCIDANKIKSKIANLIKNGMQTVKQTLTENSTKLKQTDFVPDQVKEFCDNLVGKTKKGISIQELESPFFATLIGNLCALHDLIDAVEQVEKNNKSDAISNLNDVLDDTARELEQTLNQLSKYIENPFDLKKLKNSLTGIKKFLTNTAVQSVPSPTKVSTYFSEKVALYGGGMKQPGPSADDVLDAGKTRFQQNLTDLSDKTVGGLTLMNYVDQPGDAPGHPGSPSNSPTADQGSYEDRELNFTLPPDPVFGRPALNMPNEQRILEFERNQNIARNSISRELMQALNDQSVTPVLGQLVGYAVKDNSNILQTLSDEKRGLGLMQRSLRRLVLDMSYKSFCNFMQSIAGVVQRYNLPIGEDNYNTWRDIISTYLYSLTLSQIKDLNPSVFTDAESAIQTEIQTAAARKDNLNIMFKLQKTPGYVVNILLQQVVGIMPRKTMSQIAAVEKQPDNTWAVKDVNTILLKNFMCSFWGNYGDAQLTRLALNWLDSSCQGYQILASSAQVPGVTSAVQGFKYYIINIIQGFDGSELEKLFIASNASRRKYKGRGKDGSAGFALPNLNGVPSQSEFGGNPGAVGQGAGDGPNGTYRNDAAGAAGRFNFGATPIPQPGTNMGTTAGVGQTGAQPPAPPPSSQGIDPVGPGPRVGGDMDAKAQDLLSEIFRAANGGTITIQKLRDILSAIAAKQFKNTGQNGR